MPGTIEDHKTLVRLTKRVAISAGIATALLVVSSVSMVQLLSLSMWFVPKVTVLFVLALAAISRYLPTHQPLGQFGPANQVTLARLALTSLLGGFLGESSEDIAWFAVGMSSLVLVLDGLDGWLARRGGWTSAFGARFDMETDALLILIMAALTWQLEKAGMWVLLSGLIRYLFVASAMIWPWLSAALPASRRRQTICVLQVLSLLLSLSPVVGHPWSSNVAVGGLLLLCYSFVVDVIWLRRHRRYHKMR